MNHYDVRGPYSQELGRILAKTYDQNVARVMVLGARAPNPMTSRGRHPHLERCNMDTDKDALRARCSRLPEDRREGSSR
jgi:hypothetical protein